MKREKGSDGSPAGAASTYLHDKLNVGDLIEVTSPACFKIEIHFDDIPKTFSNIQFFKGGNALRHICSQGGQ